MTTHCLIRQLWRFALGGLLYCSLLYSARAQAVDACEQAGRAAEQAFALPSGLLLAIGRVESGRWDALLGRVVPWPWAIDANGQGRMFDNAADAIAAVHALQTADSPSIDVGCFQINLAWHPDAFANMTQAFDPASNALYAAQLLVTLRSRFGSWQNAVAAYHSATPEFGIPYQQRVYAAWTGDPAVSLVSGEQFTMIAGVHVWGPATASGESRSAVTNPANSPPLPRIITPGN